jgi:hypothetical protein
MMLVSEYATEVINTRPYKYQTRQTFTYLGIFLNLYSGDILTSTSVGNPIRFVLKPLLLAISVHIKENITSI